MTRPAPADVVDPRYAATPIARMRCTDCREAGGVVSVRPGREPETIDAINIRTRRRKVTARDIDDCGWCLACMKARGWLRDPAERRRHAG